jgi:hypothetical protein
MARQLRPVTLAPSGHMNLYVESNSFHSGFTDALTKLNVRGFDISGCPNESTIVAILTNLEEIAVEGWATPEKTRYFAGLVAGWCLRQNVGVEV